jgi:hypothetical protein
MKNLSRGPAAILNSSSCRPRATGSDRCGEFSCFGTRANADETLTARLEELSTDVIAEPPDYLVAATLRKLVWRKEQHELIGNFEAVRLQPDAAVGKVFYEAGTFCARAAHDRGHASKLMARCSTPLKHACGTRFLWSGDDPHLKWIAIHRCKPANERPRVNFKFDMALEARSRRVVGGTVLKSNHPAQGAEIAPASSARTKLAESAPMVAVNATFEPTAKPSAVNSRRFSICLLAASRVSPPKLPQNPLSHSAFRNAPRFCAYNVS